MFRKKNVFISHSSNNKVIAEQLCAYLTTIGVNESKIFCSSIVGQGIDNGEKLNTAINKAIVKSKILIYILSYDFLKSSYCMEELGLGWYLSENKKAICYYLVLPDMKLSDLQGFVNSKIDKFSFIDKEHKDDLGLFTENLCNKLKIKPLKHSFLLNAENTFFSAAQASFDTLVKRQEEIKLLEKCKKDEKKRLKETIKKYEGKIDKLNNDLQRAKDNKNNHLLKREYETICNDYYLLGSGAGITKEQYKSFSNGFWFRFVNKYNSILKQLMEERIILHPNYSIEMLLANIYSHHGDLTEAFEHLKKYVEFNNSNFYPNYFVNVIIDESNDAQEIIDILKNKIANTEMGIVKDSYKKTLEFFEKRKSKLAEGKNA